MKITSTNILTEEQKKEIEALQKICYDFDGLENKAFLSNEINFDKNLPCFLLGYEGSKLISFLTAFMPQSQEAEIIAFTHPNYRRQGYFITLLETIIEIIKKAGVLKVLFAIEAKSQTGVDIIHNIAWQAKLYPPNKISYRKLNHSEYRLSCSNNSPISLSPHLSLQLVTNENKGICSRLTDEIFQMPKGENDNFIQNAIDSKDRDAYLVFFMEKPIGIFNLNYEGDTAFIYGLGIQPSYQHKGFGKQLLHSALNIAFTKVHKVILDVDSDNPQAFNLYIHNGFIVEFQVDYYLYDL